MRRCLQDRAYHNIVIHQNTSKQLTCIDIVDGTKNDLRSGIIGSHTICNRLSGFCTTLNNHGRTCFGYALGNAWGPVCIGGGSFTPGGSWTSVGLCHFICQIQECMEHGISPIQFLNTLCRGYQAGCLNTDRCNGGSSKLNCILSCPTIDDIPLLEKYLLTSRNENTSSVFRQYLQLILVHFNNKSNFTLESIEQICMKIIGRKQPGCYISG